MPITKEYKDQIIARLNDLAPIEAKAMFGGVSLYREGLIVGILDNDRLLFKVDDSNRAEYEAAGKEIFRPNPAQPGTMPYYEVPESIQNDPVQLLVWLNKSTEVAQSKKSKSKKN